MIKVGIIAKAATDFRRFQRDGFCSRAGNRVVAGVAAANLTGRYGAGPDRSMAGGATGGL